MLTLQIKSVPSFPNLLTLATVASCFDAPHTLKNREGREPNPNPSARGLSHQSPLAIIRMHFPPFTMATGTRRHVGC